MALDLSHALTIAIAATRAAGELLRADFHRPGGPRGAGDHADVDAEAEGLLRDALLGAFPETAWLGEETGAAGPPDAAYRWLVDPNDGTASYLKGMRGSTVSVALVCRGLPILGVVFAPLAPDDDGDLLAWAEGLPLTRNGAPILRLPLPEQLGESDVVLNSQDADRNVEANAACCAPARYRAVPSVAYRLALFAAGEGEAAVSLNGPTGWDLAAGHALLRAVGGELVDAGGRPVRYDDAGGGGRVFGGSLAVAQALASRPWGDVFRPGARVEGLVRLRRGEAIADAGVLRRAQGTLLGQLAGDALGSMVEFKPAAEIRRRHPHGLRAIAPSPVWRTSAGQPTDDSELGLALARSLVAAPGDIEAIRSAYRRWYDSDPFDIGNTTARGILGDPDFYSQANGGLMRASPLGIFGHRMPATALAELARAECALTHPHPICRDASAVFVGAIAHAIRTGAAPVQVWEAALGHARSTNVAPEITTALEMAASEPPRDFQTQMGWVLIALQNAFFQLLHAKTLEDGVVATAMAGGDTDTNAAIAGALLGAVHGRGAVPLQWQRALLACRAHSGSTVPRPATYWPVDAPELAERLLLAAPTDAHRA